MAALLCRLLFVEPCKACASCCSECCECFGSCCDSCCAFVTQCCDKPFSGCLVTSVILNSIAFIMGIIGIVSSLDANPCDSVIMILTIILLVSAIINVCFSYYMYNSINKDEDNPLFQEPKGDDTTSVASASARLWNFFKYDVWMAVYIVFVIGFLVAAIVSYNLAFRCSSGLGSMLYGVSLVSFLYLAVSTFILFSYVALDAFKEWAIQPQCWCIPCLWPCLCIGCCLRCAEDDEDSKCNNQSSRQQYPAQSQRAHPEERVLVVQQKQHQPPPDPPVVVQQYQPQPVKNSAPYNPSASSTAQVGVVVMHQSPYQPPPQQQQYHTPPNHSEPGGSAAQPQTEEKQNGNELKEKSIQAAKAAGQQAKKAGTVALGWMAKKMNDLNDKVQEKNDEKGKNKSGEGEGEGQKSTY